ncbi:hypothetical protein ACJX0J_041119 [Zea mays]
MTLPVTFVSALTSFLYISVALIFVTLNSFASVCFVHVLCHLHFTENPILHLDMFMFFIWERYNFYDFESLVSTSLIFGTSFLSSTLNNWSHTVTLTHFLIGSNTIPSIPVNLDSDAENSVQDINSPEKNAPPIHKPKKALSSRWDKIRADVIKIVPTLNHLQMILYTC